MPTSTQHDAPRIAAPPDPTGGDAAHPLVMSGRAGDGWMRAAAVGLLAAAAGLVVAYRAAKTSTGHGHFAVFWLSYALGLASALTLALRSRSSRGRALALLSLGALTFLPKLLMTPGGPRYFDEYGHVRHALDIVRTGDVFVSTPYLPIQRYYPGLELLTALVHGVTRLSVWHAGQVVVFVAHAGVLLVVWRIARLLDLSNRASVIAAVVYSLNSSYAFFDTQYSYESLGLPLCFLTIAFVLASRRAYTARGAWGLAGGAVAAGAACVVTHHVSTAVLLGVVVLVAAFVPARRLASDQRAARVAPWVATTVTAAFALVWIAAVARPTYGYIEPHVRSGLEDSVNWLRGQSKRTFDNGGEVATRRTLFAGSDLPFYEIVCAFLAPVLAVGAAVVAFLRRRHRMLVPFYALVGLYLVSMPLVLTTTGSETAHRAWAFGYLGIALVIAAADDLWDELVARFPFRKLVVGGVAALLVVAVGNVAAGENVYYRFPGPLTFATDTRSRGDELDRLTAWLDENLPAGTRVVTDRFTGEAVIAGTQLTVPAPEDYLVYRLYREGGELTPRVREYLRARQFRYFILDRRIGFEQPVQRLFPGYLGPRSVSSARLGAAARSDSFSVVHRTPTYLVLRIEA
jgi:hypothetical protein